MERRGGGLMEQSGVARTPKGAAGGRASVCLVPPGDPRRGGTASAGAGSATAGFFPPSGGCGSPSWLQASFCWPGCGQWARPAPVQLDGPACGQCSAAPWRAAAAPGVAGMVAGSSSACCLQPRAMGGTRQGHQHEAPNGGRSAAWGAARQRLRDQQLRGGRALPRGPSARRSASHRLPAPTRAVCNPARAPGRPARCPLVWSSRSHSWARWRRVAGPQAAWLL